MLTLLPNVCHSYSTVSIRQLAPVGTDYAQPIPATETGVSDESLLTDTAVVPSSDITPQVAEEDDIETVEQ